jgi:predicted nucleic acid-binding Zn ribbon protein
MCLSRWPVPDSTYMTERYAVSDKPDQRTDEETGVTRLSTVDSGKPLDSVDEPSPSVPERADDIAQRALAGAQRISRTSRVGRRGRRRKADERRSGYSGSGPDDRDPQPIGKVAAGLFSERGWDRPVAEARVFADWATLVGPDVASRCKPVGLRDGELRLAAESTAWATQLRLLSSTLLAKLVAELGPHVVTRLSIGGPVGPSWKHGPRSVPGARGPRDTYG